MFSLSWDVDELKNITAECRKVYYDLESCITACTDQLFQEQNVPKKLTSIRSKLTDIIRRTAHFRRNPASHVFVLMVSSDARNKKPYALPVQCIPYAGLKETDLRRLINDLCREMVSLGMDVSGKELPTQIVLTILYIHPIGFVSDGEFNFLRAKGYTRPLSVLQIRSSVRNMYSRMSLRKMLSLITPKGQFFFYSVLFCC